MVPFLRPNLVTSDKLIPYLERIDHSRLYSNFGPLNCHFESLVLEGYFKGVGALTTVNNATTGLMLAISQVKRPSGRYALMPSFTFAATPLAAKWCGLEPYFVDIDPEKWCMDTAMVTSLVAQLGDDLAVVVPYATFGSCIDLEFYVRLHEQGIPVVVDAAPCFGSAGAAGNFGDGFPGLVVFSFHATKSFGIGEGGLVYSADVELIQALRQSSNFGFSANRTSSVLGLNAKMSEYSAAVALVTLECFPDKVKIRQKIHDMYVELLTQAGLLTGGWCLQSLDGSVAHQFFPILCDEKERNREVVERLSRRGIEARTYFAPACHHHDQFNSCPRTTMVVTERIEGRILSLPLWEEMTDRDINLVVRGLVE
ncbi:aminotransferase class I/II-fold pyridoxal phosphate-dependent enzyme [Geobacter sp.]|uniref:DegT/DnrJ/EryC1/StrS family aminotransferase n=1 Tax=Geobacter sp. TaxID=46610 RepID=UPI0026139B1D|nr:aminotransferase class I/II-fold pyridoxal phosphate-dependent enzyme [Geobacter sp.]